MASALDLAEVGVWSAGSLSETDASFIGIARALFSSGSESPAKKEWDGGQAAATK
jgi:hypothetical protein